MLRAGASLEPAAHDSHAKVVVATPRTVTSGDEKKNQRPKKAGRGFPAAL